MADLAIAPGDRPLISVAICTYNRDESLDAVLETLSSQSLDRELYEVLVIDNASSDNTKEVVGQRRTLGARYIYEPKQGLSFARNRGWEESLGSYVGYIDDDCQVPDDWLEIAYEIIRDVGPAALGGPYYPYFRSTPPRWFKEEYGSYVHAKHAGAIHEGAFLSGGNSFYQRDILQLVGGFNPQLGMSGPRLAFGEETDLQQRIRSRFPGAAIYYDPRLWVYHLVSEEKMDLAMVARRRFVDGRYAFLLFHDTSGINESAPRKILQRVHSLSRSARPLRWVEMLVVSFATALHVIYLLADGSLGALLRSRKTFPYLQNYWYERTFLHIRRAGWLCQQLLGQNQLVGCGPERR